MDEKRVEEISRALTAKGVDRPCPRCGNHQFTVVAEFSIVLDESSSYDIGAAGEHDNDVGSARLRLSHEQATEKRRLPGEFSPDQDPGSDEEEGGKGVCRHSQLSAPHNDAEIRRGHRGVKQGRIDRPTGFSVDDQQRVFRRCLSCHPDR